MKLSKHGIELIQRYEGFRSCPYLDAVNIPTIGYGTTHYNNGTKVTLHDRCLKKEEATEIMRQEIDKVYGHAVNVYVQIPLTQNEFDALVSFTYNEGPGALKTSHLLRYINAGKLSDAANEFYWWTKAGGRILKGLKKRRNEERLMFIGDLDGLV